MSISSRRYRVGIYHQTDTGSGGIPKKTWTRQNSTAADRLWWASRAVPSGRETVVGARPEHRLDAEFLFPKSTSAVTNDALIVSAGVQYHVRAIKPRDHGTNELLVECEKSQETYPLVDPA